MLYFVDVDTIKVIDHNTFNLQIYSFNCKPTTCQLRSRKQTGCNK